MPYLKSAGPQACSIATVPPVKTGLGKDVNQWAFSVTCAVVNTGSNTQRLLSERKFLLLKTGVHDLFVFVLFIS